MSRGGLYAAYQRGRIMLHAGERGEAIELFQWLAHQSDPGLAADARLALAFAYLSSSQPGAARIELERVRAQDAAGPHAARAGYYLAILALNEGDAFFAKRLCEEVIQRVPRSDEALEARLLLVDLVASQVSPQEALATLRETFSALLGTSGERAASQAVPSRHRGTLAKKLADLARQAGAYGQAIGWYELAWQDLPAQQSELDYWLASCYEEAGDLMVALHRYQAIAQVPWQIRGQLAAAKLLERDDRWQEAVTLYERVAHQPVPEAKIAQEILQSKISHRAGEVR